MRERNASEAHRWLYQDVLPPWLTLVEETINLDLVPDVLGERQGGGGRVFTEFQLAEKLRGSFREESEVLTAAGGGAWMTPNEIRALKNLPPVENGDRLRESSQTVPGGQVQA